MLSSSPVQVQPLWFCVFVSWCAVENIFFWYCVEILLFCHEGTYTLAEVTDLDADIYRRKALLAHRPMILIVSGYTLAI